MIRRSLTWAVMAVMFGVLFAGSRADASGRYCYTGGQWSRRSHAGWHRYYGGQPVGYYYAPRPVYVVRRYAEPDHCRDRSYAYYRSDRPSFGLTIRFGGGRSHYARYRPSHYRYRDEGYRPHSYARYRDGGYRGGTYARYNERW